MNLRDPGSEMGGSGMWADPGREAAKGREREQAEYEGDAR